MAAGIAMAWRIRVPSRRWLGLGGVAVALGLVAIVLAWPSVIRRVAIARIEAITHRTVEIQAVHLNPFTGRLAVEGLRLMEADVRTPFTDFERLDVRIRPLALLRGHLWIREAVLQGSTVRIVRFPDRFNLSDLIEGSAPSGRVLDVTVDRFVVTRGTITFEDRALPEPREWRSENVEIEARHLSTLRDDGTADGTSVTAGAPVSVAVRGM